MNGHMPAIPPGTLSTGVPPGTTNGTLYRASSTSRFDPANLNKNLTPGYLARVNCLVDQYVRGEIREGKLLLEFAKTNIPNQYLKHLVGRISSSYTKRETALSILRKEFPKLPEENINQFLNIAFPVLSKTPGSDVQAAPNPASQVQLDQ